MTPLRLVLRSIAYHWRSHAPSVLSVAVATMVMAGALLVGHSVKASLADSALRRLGQIGHALSATTMFVPERVDPKMGTAALLVLDGVAETVDDPLSIPNIQVVGCDKAFAGVFGAEIGLLTGREVAINEPLASDLGARVGDEILLRVRRPSQSAAALFQGRARENAFAATRVTVARILPRSGAGEFSLVQPTTLRRTLFVSREWLADRLGNPSQANTLVAGLHSDLLSLNAQVERRFRLEDLGMSLKRTQDPRRWVIGSTRIVLDPESARAAEKAALREGFDSARLSVSLALSIRNAKPGGRSVHYATVASVDPPTVLGRDFEPQDALPTPWLAQALAAQPGDRIELEVLKAKDDGTYEPAASPTLYRMAPPIVDPSLRAEPALAPDVAGVSDAQSIGDWKPPFPVDMGLVTPADEDYWDRYRAAPKLFLHPRAMEAVWSLMGEPKDSVTGIIIARNGDQATGGSLGSLEGAVVEELGRSGALPKFRPIRQEALEASQGATDFAGLFFGLGLFVVFAGGGLAYGVVHHMVERRTSQAGMLMALGCGAQSVRRWMLLEVLLVAVAGAVVGTFLAVPYAQASIRHLGTVWGGSTSAVTLKLAVDPVPVLTGLALGIGVGSLAGWLACRAATQGTVLGMLSGWQAKSVGNLSAKFHRVKGIAIYITAPLLTLTLVAAWFVPSWRTALFAGALALGAALVVMLLQLAALRPAIAPDSAVSRPSLVLRNLAVNLRSSTITVLVLVCASSVLILAAANRRSSNNFHTSGFDLVVRTSVPLPVDPSTAAGRKALKFNPEFEKVLGPSTIVAVTASPGEDASCSNLARPRSPRLLGLTRDQQKMLLPNNATLSDGPGMVAAAGDSDTVLWQLHSKQGESFEYRGTNGRRASLKFEQLLPPGLFAGDILVSEESLRRLYPDVRGPSVLLVKSPVDPGETMLALRRGLADYGVEVRIARELVQALADVQNLYIGAFLALGSLGVLLGMLGVALAVQRGAADRRRAHALMLSLGLPRSLIVASLAVEQCVLLVVGLALGASLARWTPGSSTQVEWPMVAGTLVAALAVGIVAALASAVLAARSCSTADLRKE